MEAGKRQLHKGKEEPSKFRQTNIYFLNNKRKKGDGKGQDSEEKEEKQKLKDNLGGKSKLFLIF
jgi:hypothetical protein